MSISAVLIETLWNVKHEETTKMFWSLSSINRNIVECKAYTIGITEEYTRVLIETLWNVKEALKFRLKIITSINRNIVECKEKLLYGWSKKHKSINRNIVECKV